MTSRAQRILNLCVVSKSQIPGLRSEEDAILCPDSSSHTTHGTNSTQELPNFCVEKAVTPETETILPECTNTNFETSNNFDIENIPILLLAEGMEIDKAIESIDCNLPQSLNLMEYDCEAGTSGACCSNNIDQSSSDLDDDYVPNDECETSSDDENSLNNYCDINSSDKDNVNNVIQEATNGDDQESNNQVPWGDMSEGRKRKNIANKSEWKRNQNQLLRMKGEDYVGFSRDKQKNFKHDVPRAARKLGEPCVSKMCTKSKKRFAVLQYFYCAN